MHCGLASQQRSLGGLKIVITLITVITPITVISDYTRHGD